MLQASGGLFSFDEMDLNERTLYTWGWGEVLKGEGRLRERSPSPHDKFYLLTVLPLGLTLEESLFTPLPKHLGRSFKLDQYPTSTP